MARVGRVTRPRLLLTVLWKLFLNGWVNITIYKIVYLFIIFKISWCHNSPLWHHNSLLWHHNNQKKNWGIWNRSVFKMALSEDANFSHQWEQRANVKYCVKKGMSATETYTDMKDIYGKECMSQATIFQYHADYRKKKCELTDAVHSGRPKSVCTFQQNQTVRSLIMDDRWTTLREISDITVHHIVHDILNMHWWPRYQHAGLLVCWPRNRRNIVLQALSDFSVDTAKTAIISWRKWLQLMRPMCLGTHQKQNRSSLFGNYPGNLHQQNHASKEKTMFIVFFDCEGIILRHAVPNGQSVTGGHYAEVRA